MMQQAPHMQLCSACLLLSVDKGEQPGAGGTGELGEALTIQDTPSPRETGQESQVTCVVTCDLLISGASCDLSTLLSSLPC